MKAKENYYFGLFSSWNKEQTSLLSWLLFYPSLLYSFTERWVILGFPLSSGRLALLEQSLSPYITRAQLRVSALDLQSATAAGGGSDPLRGPLCPLHKGSLWSRLTVSWALLVCVVSPVSLCHLLSPPVPPTFVFLQHTGHGDVDKCALLGTCGTF